MGAAGSHGCTGQEQESENVANARHGSPREARNRLLHCLSIHRFKCFESLNSGFWILLVLSNGSEATLRTRDKKSPAGAGL
jgi:hypothetical protein